MPGISASTRKNLSKPINDELTPRQQRAVLALLESRSVAEAARRADVPVSTLRYWRRSHEPFQRRLRELRQEALGHATLRLQRRASVAVEKLFDMIESDQKIEGGRAALIRTALHFAHRAAAYDELHDRIELLEQAARRASPGAFQADDDQPAKDVETDAESNAESNETVQ